jgi:uncharacterized DUF497 family protein
VKITYDPAKRARTLKERGLDFEDCVEVFAGPKIDIPDNRRDYGEPRTITFGVLEGRIVVVVWTLREGMRRVISMRYANEREKARFGQQLR